MPDDDAALLTDRDYLQTVQYRSADNLAARQSIYQFQRPRLDLPSAVLDLAGLGGLETVADVGCGNGRYVAELARRGHAGRILGMDLSAGMLRAARAATAATGAVPVPVGVAAADAVALPLADQVADVTLSMHMLYHVPDRQAAVRELRRVTRDGGQVLVVLNGSDHLLELDDLLLAASRLAGLPHTSWIEANGAANLDNGAELLGSVFGSVERHDFAAELLVPEPQPVLDYVRSMWLSQQLTDPDALLAAVAQVLPSGSLQIRTHAGCLVCR